MGGVLPCLNNSAEALTTTSGAVLAGDGADLWSDTSLNFRVLNDISNKLFGDNDPVEYIKTMKDTQTDSYVIPASTINSKVGSDSGLVVKLDGKDWMVASLTLADIGDKKDNIIMTLYLAEDLGESQYYSNDSTTKGNNMYSRSTVRNHLLTNSTWALFNQKGENGFASKYLVQPKYIKYQKNQTWVGRDTDFASYNYPNEALEAQSTGWHSNVNYQPADTYDSKRYDAWGEDYIWLPSASETGWKNHGATTCIWKLSNAQRARTTDYSWLRSGNWLYYGRAYGMSSAGEYITNKDLVTNTYGVRPALHFNLSAASMSFKTGIDNPENVTTTYNGNAQTVKGLYDADNSSVNWYNSEYYENSNRITLSFQDDKGNAVAEMKNAGTYWVKADMVNWVKEVDDQIAAESTGWSEAEIAAAKEIRRPKFKGDPVTEEGHVESGTVRWFKFIINPAELEIPTVAEASKTYTGSDIEFAISGYDSAKMTATLPDGYTLSDDGKISFKNAKTYPINISIKDNNYCWKGTVSNPDRSAKTLNITVTQKGIIINFTSSSNKFTMAVGDNVTFTAVPSAADVAAGDTVVPTITYYKGSDTANVTSATGAELNASGLSTGTYTLGAKLENKDGTANSNYKITTVTPQTVTVGSKNITIENVTWQYVQDGEPTEISGNSVTLTYNGKEFRFTVKETTEELRAKGVKIDSYTNNVQTNATNGAITVKVKLVPYDESFEFSDPTKTEVEFSLTVTINKIELKLSDFKWSAEPTNELEYTGNTQTVTIVSGLPSFLQVVYHGNSGLSVGPYTTTILSITVKNDADSVEMSKNYTSFEPEDYADYKYEWSITKKKIVANWTNAEHTTTDGKKITIPKVSGVEDGILEYSYTKYPSGEAITLAEILASYTETAISVYNVTVKIADGKTDSYMLLNSKNEVKDEVTQRFSVGDNKKAVTVSLIETKVYFNNQPQAVKLNYTGEGITMGDFSVVYQLINADGSEGEATNTAPTAVGKYKVTITLQGEKANTHIIIGENVFEYTIAHKDRFILTEAAAASHGYKFLYENFHAYENDISEYVYSAESVVYIANLAYADTLADLLRQFANAEDITAYTADNTLIEDLTTMLATGMMLRIMDGETVLNQLTISVMGDIDGDGDIGTADKARLNSYTLDNLPLTGAYLLACDLDGDGEVGTADKARLNAYTLDTLDIYAGLTLRATAQTSSVERDTAQTIIAEQAAAQTSAQASFVECNTVQTSSVGTSAITAEPVYACESTTTYAASAAKEYVDNCEIASNTDMADNIILLLSDETTYIAITDIKNIVFATSIYVDCKQRV